MSQTATRPKMTRLALAVLAACCALSLGLADIASAVAPDNRTQLAFEGCNPSTTTVLPQPSGPYAGKFVCSDVTNGPLAEYTSGNLGKSWAELDLVPFRLTAVRSDGNRNNPVPAQTWTVAVALDNLRKTDGAPGFDVLTTPELNTTLSTPGGCSLVSGAQLTTPTVGGTERSIYRLLTVTQQPGASCVIDFTGRLALGSAGNPGSSLHANLLNESLGVQGIGAHEIPLPVNDIGRQGIAKTMSANRGSAYDWTINKATSPASLHFGNTCGDTRTELSKDLEVTVTWTKTAPSASGDVVLTTLIKATNPSHRAITVNVTDEIFPGSTSSGTPIHTESTPAGGVVIPANTANHQVLLHSITVPAGTDTDYSDRAVATYTDTVTNVAIPGERVATATAPVAVDTVNPLNGTAQITESEALTSAGGLQYSTDAVTTGATGAFDPAYTLGTKTTDPVTWKATVSDSGQAVFDKTVYLAGAQTTTGSLDDTATLTHDFSPRTDSKQVPITADKECATVKVTKETVPANTAGTFAFTRDIDRHTGALTSGFSLGHGQTETVTDVVPNDGGTAYTVGEDLAAAGQPAGFTVSDLDCFTTDGTTPDTDSATTIPAGGASGGADIHVSAGETVSCRFENTKQAPPPPGADIEIVKSQVGGDHNAQNQGTELFPFRFSGANVTTEDFSLSEATSPKSYTVAAGSYRIDELDSGSDFHLWQISCVDRTTGAPFGGATTSATPEKQGNAQLTVAAGDQVRCTFTNVEEVRIEFRKDQVGGPQNAAGQGTDPFRFRLDGFGSNAERAGFDLRESDGLQVHEEEVGPNGDSFTIHETASGADYRLTDIRCVDADTGAPRTATTSSTPATSGSAQFDLGPGDDIRCTFQNTRLAEVIAEKQTDPDETNGETFAFSTDLPGASAFSLADDGVESRKVLPGTYRVTEATKTGYRLTAITCGTGGAGDPATGRATYTVAAGDQVRCVFTNTKDAAAVVPQVAPPPAAQLFVEQVRQAEPPAAAPVAQAAPSRRVTGTARLRGPSGCVARPFRVQIRGRQITSVSFYLGKRRVRTLRARGAQAAREQVLTYRLDPRDLPAGKVHKVSVRVVFTRASRTRTRNLRLAFHRCRQQIRPTFTG